MYNLRDEKPRSFDADYPNGGQFDELGKLKFDIEGRPINREAFLVGRGKKGQDNPLPQAEFNTLAEKTTGRKLDFVAKNEIGGNSGRVLLNPTTRRPIEIQLSKSLTEKQASKVAPHELGHAIDQLAGEIPIKGLSKELKPVYNELNTGQRRTRNLTGPNHLGYKGDDVPREYMAEAIRAYMTNPNALKTVAPKTAARIREYVNSNPALKDIIQFNSVAGGLVMGQALGGDED